MDDTESTQHKNEMKPDYNGFILNYVKTKQQSKPKEKYKIGKTYTIRTLFLKQVHFLKIFFSELNEFLKEATLE